MLSIVDRTVVLTAVAIAAAGLGYGASLGASVGAAVPVTGSARATHVQSPGTHLGSSDAVEIDWTTLTSYRYEPGLPNLPETIKALDGKHVVLGGFQMMLYEYDDIHEFFLVANHMGCCFGQPPGFSGQIYVKIKDDRGLPRTNEPLRVTGTFQAKEVVVSGFTLAIWSILDAEVQIIGY